MTIVVVTSDVSSSIASDIPLQDENRRFRVKFAPMAPQITSLETCRLCITTLSPLVPIREMVATSGMDVVSDSQIPLPREDSQMLMSQSTQQQEETGSQLETTCTSSLVGSSVHIAEDQTKEPLEEDICPNEQNMMSLPDLAKVTSTWHQQLICQLFHNPAWRHLGSSWGREIYTFDHAVIFCRNDSAAT